MEKNLGTAVLVAKAYKKMKKGQAPEFEEIREENGTVSRLMIDSVILLIRLSVYRNILVCGIKQGQSLG